MRSLDMFGGPARGASRFIVTKRTGASQFAAVVLPHKHARKKAWEASVFRETLSSDWIILAPKKRRPRRLSPMILTALRGRSVSSLDRRAVGIRRTVCGVSDRAALIGEE